MRLTALHPVLKKVYLNSMCSFHGIKGNSSFFIITTVYLITNQNELLNINLSCLIVTKENITKVPKFFFEKSYEIKGNTTGFTAVYGHGVTGLLISIFKVYQDFNKN